MPLRFSQGCHIIKLILLTVSTPATLLISRLTNNNKVKIQMLLFVKCVPDSNSNVKINFGILSLGF